MYVCECAVKRHLGTNARARTQCTHKQTRTHTRTHTHTHSKKIIVDNIDLNHVVRDMFSTTPVVRHRSSVSPEQSDSRGDRTRHGHPEVGQASEHRRRTTHRVHHRTGGRQVQQVARQCLHRHPHHLVDHLEPDPGLRVQLPGPG